MLIAYKFRLYPNKEQASLLSKTFGCARFVWNKLVESFNAGTLEKVTEKTLKDSEEFSFLREVSAATLQQVRINFDEFKKQFFSKTRKTKLGRPSFKKKGGVESFRLPSQKFKLIGNKLKLEKIPAIKMVMDRGIPENAIMKNCTVSKTPSGKYFVSILVDQTIEPLEKTNKSVGIDLGLIDFATLSNGVKFLAKNVFRKNQTKLGKLQRNLPKKIKTSNRYKKLKLKIARLHERISNIRSHFLHETSKKIVTDFDIICMENLSVKSMVKNRRLSKSISDAGWSKFVSMIEYKCKFYEKEFIQIDRFFASSKICSICKTKNSKLKLSDRTWKCDSCGHSHDRDINAANNILIEGLKNR